MSNLDLNQIPKHVAIIMDGNGRWAEKRGLPKISGHDAGMKAMKEIVKHSSVLGVEYLTVYAFSTENWKRSQDEIKGIMSLLIKYVQLELDELYDNNVIVNIIGDTDKFPKNVQKSLDKAINRTSKNTGMKFNIALNYGSRAEIVKAVKEIAKEIENTDNPMKIDDIDDAAISSHLYTKGMPDPDIIIRTSGEERLSNFLLWQAAYSEFVFSDKLWPDYSIEEYEKSLITFQNRKRRFGGR